MRKSALNKDSRVIQRTRALGHSHVQNLDKNFQLKNSALREAAKEKVPDVSYKKNIFRAGEAFDYEDGMTAKNRKNIKSKLFWNFLGCGFSR